MAAEPGAIIESGKQHDRLSFAVGGKDFAFALVKVRVPKGVDMRHLKGVMFTNSSRLFTLLLDDRS